MTQEEIKGEKSTYIPEEDPIAGEPTPKNEPGEETPTNDNPATDELQEEVISKEKFDEIDKARRTFYKENKELKAKIAKLSPTPKKETPSDEWKERVDFLLVNRDFNKQEFDHIAAVSKRDNVSLSEAAEKEMDYISFRRKKVAEENKIPSSSAAKSSSLQKTEEEILKMTPEEIQAYEDKLNKAAEGGEI